MTTLTVIVISLLNVYVAAAFIFLTYMTARHLATATPVKQLASGLAARSRPARLPLGLAHAEA